VKIAHLVIAGDVAGGQIVALRLARAAAARGDDVLFVAPAEGPFTRAVRDAGMAVHIVDVNRLFRARGAWRLLRLLRREGVDILHMHTAVAANIAARIAGRLAGAKVVSHLHIENHFRSSPLAHAVYRALDNATVRLSHAILAVSEDTRRALVRQGYPAGRVETVHNGVELPPAAGIANVRAELGLAPGSQVVGSVARLCDVKGQRELIDAFARLRNGAAGARLLLVGEDLETGGRYRADLERRAAELGVGDRVHFAGHRDDVPAVLDSIDVFALPSWTEGLPMTVLEAMAHGRPVVATPVGGTPELVVDGETGVLVRPRDPDDIARGLARVLADPEAARAMGEAGRRRVAERFTAAEMERRVLAAYDRIAGR
jgi:glycosyltransferase involved in cell wall biosynthesis